MALAEMSSEPSFQFWQSINFLLLNSSTPPPTHTTTCFLFHRTRHHGMAVPTEELLLITLYTKILPSSWNTPFPHPSALAILFQQLYVCFYQVFFFYLLCFCFLLLAFNLYSLCFGWWELTTLIQKFWNKVRC